MAETWDVGDTVTVWAEFRNSLGQLMSPTTVTLTVKKPDGTVSTLAASNPSTGRYEALVALDQHGTWYYRFLGTGALIAAEEGTIKVRRSKVLT